MIGIIYNPHTNKGISGARMESFRSTLDSRGMEYLYAESEYPGHTVELAREMSDTCDIIVAAGGDGTVHEAVNGAYGKDVAFFILPLGSGNDISRVLGINGRSDEELADILAEGRTVEYDAGMMNDEKVTVQFVSYGIVTHIIGEFEKRTRTSKLSYYSTMLKAIRTFDTMDYTVRWNGKERDFRADFVSVQNIPNAGGGMMIDPGADYNDGMFDLVIIEHTGFRRMMCNLVALLRGKLTDQPNVLVERISEAEIVPKEGVIRCCIDGELFDSGGVKVVMDRKIRFVTG